MKYVINFWEFGRKQMTEFDAIKLFKCLADKSRIQIVKTLMIEDMYVERIAERLDLTPSTISFHLKKLGDAGVVTFYKDQYYMMYSLRKEILMTNILDIMNEKSDDAREQEERDNKYRKKILNSFFEYGKLKSIPAQRKKERIVLEEISKAFEHGKIYSEREVNIIIADFYDDFCTIRRDMISEMLLERDKNMYRLL